MNAVEHMHSRCVQERRVQVLTRHLIRQLPLNARVLDVGAGDGRMAYAVQQQRPDLQMRGMDVLVRGETFVPVSAFDGTHIPEPDGSYDAVLFVDVLHHTSHPELLLREALRVTRRVIVIKDHLAKGWLARPILGFMDRVGNRRYGVALPHNYWTEAQWRAAFAELGLEVKSWESRLGIYPWPATLVFDREMHFVAQLERAG